MSAKNDEVSFIAQIRKVGKVSLGVTIPKEIIKLLNLQQGDFVKIIIKRVKLVEEK